MGLKNLESEIFKNDSLFRNMTKHFKSINNIFESYKHLKEIIHGEPNRLEKLNDFSNQLKDFRKLKLYTVRKFDNLNSLTLKSEYSEDYSELLLNLDDNNFSSLIITNINNIHFPGLKNKQSMKIENISNYATNLKNSENIDTILNGLTRMKTDDGSKFRLKNGSKLKNKKLKSSNTNSDVEVSDNNKKMGYKNIKVKIVAKDNSEIKINSNKKIVSNFNNTNMNISLQKNQTLITPRALKNGNKNKGILNTKGSLLVPSRQSINTNSLISSYHTKTEVSKQKKTLQSSFSVTDLETIKSNNLLRNKSNNRKYSEEFEISTKSNGNTIVESVDKIAFNTNLGSSDMIKTNLFSPSTSINSNSNIVIICRPIFNSTTY
jgi:hypothetical protein